jgi:hypothetical protein
VPRPRRRIVVVVVVFVVVVISTSHSRERVDSDIRRSRRERHPRLPRGYRHAELRPPYVYRPRPTTMASSRITAVATAGRRIETSGIAQPPPSGSARVDQRIRGGAANRHANDHSLRGTEYVFATGTDEYGGRSIDRRLPWRHTRRAERAADRLEAAESYRPSERPR